MADKLKLAVWKDIETEPIEEDGIDWISYVAPTTYGPPALVAPAKGQSEARARPGQKVRYINTGPHGPPMWEIERYTTDED